MWGGARAWRVSHEQSRKRLCGFVLTPLICVTPLTSLRRV